jgi:hypothetical protein
MNTSEKTRIWGMVAVLRHWPAWMAYFILRAGFFVENQCADPPLVVSGSAQRVLPATLESHQLLVSHSDDRSNRRHPVRFSI